VLRCDVSKLRLLDLFCGAGGAALGYSRAGFEVVGVDIKPQNRYPFQFFEMDVFEAFAVLSQHFDAFHASPPCQPFSSLRFLYPQKSRHPDLVGRTRCFLEGMRRPWVIENVYGAPLRHAIMLCGTMFGLGSPCRDGAWHQLWRHRYFESSVGLLGGTCQHRGQPVGVYGHGGSSHSRCKGFQCLVKEGRVAMGIDWMTRDELTQAVPPSYTEFIGKQLMRVCGGVESGRDGDR